MKRPTDEEMANVSHAVREVFGLQLVGIDVIVDNETGKYGIIDVNAFPGTGVRQHLSLYSSRVDIFEASWDKCHSWYNCFTFLFLDKINTGIMLFYYHCESRNFI